MKNAGIFLGRENKQRDFFFGGGGGLRIKDQGIFLGMLKKSSDFFSGRQILKLCILGTKYEPHSDPPAPRH